MTFEVVLQRDKVLLCMCIADNRKTSLEHFPYSRDEGPVKFLCDSPGSPRRKSNTNTLVISRQMQVDGDNRNDDSDQNANDDKSRK